MRERRTKADERKTWTEYAAKHLLGRKIARVEYMGDDEARDYDWSESPLVLTLDDGTVLIPMRDDEGNGAGSIAGQAKDGLALMFPVLRRW